MLVSLSAFSQARLGSSLEDIKTEFPAGTLGKSSNETPIFTVILSDLRIIYFINQQGFCSGTALYPNNIVTVNGLVEKYNGKYTILSSKKWRAYLQGGILEVELIYKDGFMPYFIWTRLE